MGRRKSMVWTGLALCGLLTATGCGDKEQITLLEEENRGLYADLEMLRSEMDSAKQQRDRCDESQVKLGRKKPAPHEKSRQSCERAHDRGRQTECPLRFSEYPDRAGHQVNIQESAGIVHPAGQVRMTGLENGHRRHRHRFLIAVQADVSETPEA